MNQYSGQLGNKSSKYDFSRFIQLDSSGKEITSPEIDYLKNSLLAIYANLPDFTMYSKEMIDQFVQDHLADYGNEQLSRYAEENKEFLCVVNITSGFFDGHKIMIKSITHSNNEFKIDYNVVGVDGQEMNDANKLDFIVQNIVHLQLYEQALEDTINTEKEKLS